MARTKWATKIQDALNENPLFFLKNPDRTHHLRHEGCLQPGEVKGKKVALYAAINYSFDTCGHCGKGVRHM